MYCLFTFFCLSALALLPTKSIAGAWVQQPFHFMSLVSFGYYRAESNFNRVGRKQLNRIQQIPGGLFIPLEPAVYSQYDATLYLEYGLPQGFEIDLSLPFYTFAQQKADFGSYSVQGLADMSVALKYLWFVRPWLLSAVQFELGVPLGNNKTEGDHPTLPSQPIPLGDGEWDYAFRLFLSRSFESWPVYLTGDIAYRFRNIPRGGDDVPWLIEAGYTFYFERPWFNSLTPFVNFSGLLALKDLTEQDAIVLLTATSVTGNSPGQETIDFNPGVFIGIWGNLSLGLNYNRALAGKNSGAGWGYRIGLMWQG